MSPTEHRDEELGPKENTDDSTLADMGLSGTPAASATPIGQGDEPGAGASDAREEPEASDD